MRMAELAGKEIVNIYDGARLGVVGESDLVIEPGSGKITSILIPRKNNFISLWVDRQHMVLPWEAVKKIGLEVIIVDLDQTNLNFRRHLV
ncbi:MAG: YlmC/YmxH family sporulation protein [Peptococcaceae bacterium BICA1-7]|nr:MAG: YlmC/YmxH family sporulation protein [Peptococcaceae bacterium BICA1-7]HBV95683.1 YlmC/YmxH family sporulation protein [Desulfotomaculum sp.]